MGVVARRHRRGVEVALVPALVVDVVTWRLGPFHDGVIEGGGGGVGAGVGGGRRDVAVVFFGRRSSFHQLVT